MTPPTAPRARLLAARARIRRHPRWRWMALLVVAGGMMLSVINITIVNIALPGMAADFGVDIPAIGWVFTGFLATQATLLAVAGRAGDLYGRRRAFAVGITVLIVASVLCAVAWNAPSLIAFRILQGMGACVMAPTAFAYAATLFAPHERGTALGVMAGVIGLAPVVALNVAGALVGAFGWRAVFWFSPVVGVAVLLGAALILEETRGPAHRRFDVPGALLAAAGLFSLLLALSRGGAWGWSSPATLAAFAAGAALIAAFVLQERRTAEPMLDLGLLRLRSLATANLAALSAAAALFGVTILLPFYFTSVLGYDPVHIGLAITPIAAAFVVVAPLAGRAMNRLGSVRIATAGFAVAAAGALWLALAAPAQSYAALVPGIVLFGAGLAMCQPPITTTAIAEVPYERLGVASSLPNLSRYVGGAFGAALLSAILGSLIPAGLEEPHGLLGPEDRDLVAGGFRTTTLVAVAFLVLAALIASRMPRLDRARPAAAPAAAAGPA